MDQRDLIDGWPLTEERLMEQPRESKVECRVSFSRDGSGEVSQEFDGLLHLIEHQIGKISFWYGVLDMACSVEDLQAQYNDPESARVFLTLQGRGRTMARLGPSGMVQGQPNTWCIGIVGVAGLQSSE